MGRGDDRGGRPVGVYGAVADVTQQMRVEGELAASTIEGDVTQIRQVVMNLITNASNALQGEDGTISVGAGSHGAIRVSSRAAG